MFGLVLFSSLYVLVWFGAHQQSAWLNWKQTLNPPHWVWIPHWGDGGDDDGGGHHDVDDGGADDVELQLQLFIVGV